MSASPLRRACRMSPAITCLLFGLGLLLGGAACAFDPDNPFGGPSDAPAGTCAISGPAGDCLSCAQTHCCMAVQECAAPYRAECLQLASCWQGQGTCPVWHDGSTQAVDDCLSAHCRDLCPGPGGA